MAYVSQGVILQMGNPAKICIQDEEELHVLLELDS